MPVNTILAEYTKNEPKWKLVKSFVDEDVTALKKELRYIDEGDTSPDNVNRNTEYKAGAVMENVTKRTHDGMIGAVYRIPPTIELPASIAYMEQDVNGSGVGLTQFSKKVESETMQTGRSGILTDYPVRQDDTSKAATDGLTAKLIKYDSDQIINWRTNAGKVVLVVLHEIVQKPVAGDPFETEPADEYRVLSIIDGKYNQSRYNENGDKIGEDVIVTDYNGNALTEITFQFIGTVNNDTEIDPSLLYSIAAINKGHYRNSADLEENCFTHGQLTLGITSALTDTQWKESNPNGVKVGSRTGHFLGESGGFHSSQAQPNQLADKLMDRKETQMMQIGARLIQNGASNEREVAVMSRVGAETATLSSLTHNVSEAITQSLIWADAYMSATPSPDSITFTLNQEFVPVNLDAQQLTALIQLYNSNRIGAADLHAKLQQATIIAKDRTLEDVEAESENKDPLQTTATFGNIA